jgi:hypothetical protein
MSDCSFKLTNLKDNSIYYIIVTATNEFGEGYKPEVPRMIRT